ncbi:leucine--tRNA ligase [Candidatus Schneideria nysicola]|uniref:leucine--tRNA ligase n=1 Tax=Candidatus Schneideria nysicola TaxID=1081631 RepID=UPI001CAA5F1A|nr:class I tRNA ligase family protein [Candidatus Schneideria nysicola]UAJ65918.1 leucine--tRNA ligase [Candidatus Schneideria nysicola]
MQKNYNPKNIEEYVQKYWERNCTFKVVEDTNKEKYYCLPMMPYPSGQLHIGHVRNYTISDVISRYQRTLGKNVLQPMGWDAFGLPAEEAAIKNNTNPADWTIYNINYMKNQLKMLGFSYDWSREITTCHPNYYKWEQWLFIILYEKGLAYKKMSTVNWCSNDNTVLANEQVINGCCWRCNTPITRKELSQWFLKITDYAEQLYYDLDKLENWPEKVKMMQRNWIGRSEGIEIDFQIFNSEEVLTIFTKDKDDLFNSSYILITWDHPFTLNLIKKNKNTKLINFINKCRDIPLYQIEKDNSLKREGIDTGLYVINPINGKKLPIWITNFIKIHHNLINSLIAVPNKRKTDLDFANKNNIFNINSDKYNKNIIPIDRLLDKGIIREKIIYSLKDWCISRQRYWGVPIPMFIFKDGKTLPLSFDKLPLILKEKKEYQNQCLSQKVKSIQLETDTFDTFIESSWYYIRYTCPTYNKGICNPFLANYWLPIDQYIGGIEHANMHLIYFRFFHKILRDIGLLSSDEPARRLLCQGMVLADAYYYINDTGKRIWISPTDINIVKDKNNKISKITDKTSRVLIHYGMCKMSKSKNNGINPQFFIEKYGADTIRLFIMFAAPVESKLEWIESGIEGMSRFLKRIWKMVYEHLQFTPVSLEKNLTNLSNKNKKLRYALHKAIVKVTEDIDKKQSFNTAISTIMGLVNKFNNFQTKNDQDYFILQETLSTIVIMLSPFTPHICFILWKALGGRDNIDYVSWPVPDNKLIREQEENYLLIIQINGKLYDKFYIKMDMDKDVIYKLILQREKISNYIKNKKIINTIYIPRKIFNLVVSLNDDRKND